MVAHMRGALLVLVVVTIGFVGIACSDETEGPEAGVDVEDITDEYEAFDEDAFLDDPDPYIGDTVTVSAEVNEIISPASFTIAGGDVPELLVVGDPAGHVLGLDKVVRVTGEVVKFAVPDVEEEFDLDLDDDLYVEYGEETAIVASSVEVLPSDDPN